MRQRAAIALGLLGSLTLAACAPTDDEPPRVLRIVAPDLEPDRVAWSPATLVDGDGRRPIALRASPERREGSSPLLEVRASEAGPSLGHLLLADAAAVLHYHAAARTSPAIAERLVRHRLAVIETGESPGDLRVGLLLEPSAARPVSRRPIAELPTPEGAAIVALGQALGAWDVLTRGHVDVGGDGRATLPFFAPRAPGDWNRLVGSTLEGFLSEALAATISQRDGFRAASYTDLFAFAEELPGVAASLHELAASPEIRPLAVDLGRIDDLTHEAHEAILGYLDSVWADSLVSLEAPDSARVMLHIQTTVPASVDALRVDFAKRLSISDVTKLDRIRLIAAGKTRVARPDREGVTFPVDVRVEPVSVGPYRLASTRLEFRIEGLERAPALRWKMLARLRPRITNLVTGEIIPDSHIQSVASIDDPRFGIAHPEPLADFVAALPDRIAGPIPVRIDHQRRLLSLAEGTYTVVEDVIAPPGYGLQLGAGVELRIAPGRSILVRGPLIVNGSAERPVRVRGSSADEPWGVIALQGSGAQPASSAAAAPHSRVHWLELYGGSQDDLRGAHYPAPLSVHGQRLDIQHAVFADSRSERAIHLDRVRGSIRDSVVSHPRGRCISVARRSRLDVSGALLRDCDVGVASGRGAALRITETVFFANARAVAIGPTDATGEDAFTGGDDWILVDTPNDGIGFAAEGSAKVASSVESEFPELRSALRFSAERFRSMRAQLR